MAEYSIVASTTGFKGAFTVGTSTYAPVSETYCETCHSIGGYCGNCSGHHFAPVVELDECVYCGRPDCVAIVYGESVCGFVI